MGSNNNIFKNTINRQDSRSKVNQIVGHLLEGISNGQYKPGQRLVESALSREFGISRGPLREAMRILETKDLVELVPNRGAQIKFLAPEDISQRFQLLEALGNLAIANSAHSRMAHFAESLKKEQHLEKNRTLFSKAVNFYVKIARLNQDNLLAEYILKLNLDYFSRHIVDLLDLDCDRLDKQFSTMQQTILSGSTDTAMTEHQKWCREISAISSPCPQ
ncbi:hypothetical protein MNBD_ALPHA01-1845 [hydrothermal vent metagenome]|uniref:HTH gntR-type domain-containing protein n=1 Tax=hydrothermal vent metagenome TaxID=652676 RepID=A0A3B0T978_9ZZZZ